MFIDFTNFIIYKYFYAKNSQIKCFYPTYIPKVGVQNKFEQKYVKYKQERESLCVDTKNNKYVSRHKK